MPHLTLPLLLLILSSSGALADLSGDESALLSFRAAVGRSALPSWSPSSSPSVCSWQGVMCSNVDGSGTRVTELHLPGVGLMGSIPDGAFANLTALRVLSLRFNALTGAVPSSIAAATHLRNLYLQRNRFSGDFPAAVLQLPDLVRLNLADNNFSGEIPAGVNNLTRLGSLLLEGNGFSGQIPPLNLTALQQFNVSYNSLNGSIPSTLRKMPTSAFLGMKGLCGGPLGLCPGEIAPSLAPTEAPGSTSGAAGSGNAGSKKSSKKLSGGAIAGIAIGCAVALLILVALLLLLCCRRRASSKKTAAAVDKPLEAAAAASFAERERRMPEAMLPSNSSSGAAVPPVVSTASKKLVFFGPMAASPPFDLEDLLRASAEVLGKGTFGTAYKAVLENSEAVTVKRLKDVELTEPEFAKRIHDIGAIQHELVVPLRAYYFSRDEKLLVYDYMRNGSLSALLHGNRASKITLDWETRLAVALNAARGVEVIHASGPAASHGNIKSTNILFTESYGARLSDHGLATLVGPAFSPTRMSSYRAPEVTDIRRVSQKADVYSFGVLLLELLTGKSPNQPNEEGVDLPRWVQSVIRERWAEEVLDPELHGHRNTDDIIQLLQLAVDCAKQHPDQRPSMPAVASRIEEIQRSSSPGGDDGSSVKTGSEQ